jgi:hypothetical protein
VIYIVDCSEHGLIRPIVSNAKNKIGSVAVHGCEALKNGTSGGALVNASNLNFDVALATNRRK